MLKFTGKASQPKLKVVARSVASAENFLFSGDGEDAHLKAIDFGLAVPFDPAHLPLQVSVLEGTPWCALNDPVMPTFLLLILSLHTISCCLALWRECSGYLTRQEVRK